MNKEKEIVVICGYCEENTKHIGKVQSSDLFYCKKCGTIWDLDKEHEEIINVSEILHNIKERKAAG
jgi:Fe2+ or Zn2+ uptake regulation protein